MLWLIRQLSILSRIHQPMTTTELKIKPWLKHLESVGEQLMR